MSVSEAGYVFSFFALVMFLLSPTMGSLVSINRVFIEITNYYANYIEIICIFNLNLLII